jgi:hypothetical protein
MVAIVLWVVYFVLTQIKINNITFKGTLKNISPKKILD